MADSKVKLTIQLEGEGEIVEALAEAVRAFFDVARAPAKPALRRLEDTPPAVSIPYPRRIKRGNGYNHDQGGGE